MKKLIFLLLLGVGVANVCAQEAYRLQFYQNSGSSIGYLRITSATSAPVNVNSTTATGREWEFVPVDGESESANEPGWYYIRNVYYPNSYLCAPTSPNANFTTTSGINTSYAEWRYKFRLVKYNSAGTAANNVGRYKLVMRDGTTNYVVFLNNSNPRISTTFTQDRGLVEIISTARSWTPNSTQELVGTYNTYMAFPEVIPTTTVPDFSGYDSDYTTNTYPDLFPAGYSRAGNTRVIHSFSASGGAVGDGLYFSRIPQNASISLNHTNTSVPQNATLYISFWIRAYSDGAISTPKITEEDLQIYKSNGVSIPAGYKVGEMTASSTSGANIGTVPITIPNIGSVKNDPTGWYFYRMFYKLPSATGTNISNLITNLMKEGDGLLDIDNINVTYIDFISSDEFKFLYKNNTYSEDGNVGSAQNPHELAQVLYALPGSAGNALQVNAATRNFAYYRWHINESLTETEYVDYFDLSGRSNFISGYAGTVFATDLTGSGTKGTLSDGTGNVMDIITPEWDSNGDWDYGSGKNAGKFIVSVDGSNYIDYSYNPSVGFTEPSLSWRNNFEFRPAWEIAKKIQDALTDGNVDQNQRVMEYIELEAPHNHRLRMSPQYAPTNYYLTDNTTQEAIINGELQRGNTFTWRLVDADVDGNPTLPAGSGITSGTAPVSATYPGTNNQFLQINTANKTGVSVEYYDVYAVGSTINRHIARFKVNYSSREEVGPISPATGDLLNRVLRKKLITKLNFDQSSDVPAGWQSDPDRYEPLAFDRENPANNQPYSLGGFGVYRLAQDESSYGFMDPRFHSYPVGSDVPTGGNGLHQNAGCGFWSEYSFPQAINNNITNNTTVTGFSRGWSTTANVWDRTSYNTGGSTTMAGDIIGNMMYVDAGDFPGVFATLNIKESVCPGTTLYFSAWIVNLNGSSATSGDNETTTVRPNLIFILKDMESGTEIKRFYTGDIGQNAVGVWQQVAFSFVIPETDLGSTNAEGEQDINFRLEIRNNGLSTTGNDFALDEICIYRTNPSVVASRVTARYCVPESNKVTEQVPLDMRVEVNLENLSVRRNWIDGINNSIFYYRFIDAKNEGFAGDQNEYEYWGGNDPEDVSKILAKGTPMYPNMGLYNDQSEGYYYYGSFDLDSFVVSGTGTDENGNTGVERYIYNDTVNNTVVTLVGNLLTFQQIIPVSLLVTVTDGNGDLVFNHGSFNIYVAEASESLLTPSCAGECEFEVGFDKTNFTAYVEGIVDAFVPDELSACTNSAIYVKAQSQDVNTRESLFAFYDWFIGPVNTYPASALSYTYEVQATTNYGQEKLEGTDIRNITTSDGYIYWYSNDERTESEGWDEEVDGVWVNGEDWIASTEGQDWAWSPVNYIGYNQYGGYASYPKNPETSDYDGTTGATKLMHDDYNNFENRIIEWRTIKNDLKAFRYYFPYAAEVPQKDLTKLPVDRSKIETTTSLYRYDYETGNIYLKTGASTPIDQNDDALDDYRFTINDSYGTYVDRNGNAIDRDGDTIPAGGSIPYIDLQYSDNSGVPYTDLNRLLSRIRYSLKSNALRLHENILPVDVGTLAPYFLTAIPIDIAFYYDDDAAESEQTIEDVDWAESMQICSTPAQVRIQATAWGPDAVFGEVTELGQPTMPYFEIENENYIYTVRLPEKDYAGNLSTLRFVCPMLYFDEIKNARVKLLAVNDASGASLIDSNDKEKILYEGVYIGAIDPDIPTKLKEDYTIWVDYYYDTQKYDRIKLSSPRQMNLRWDLNEERNSFHALESYPLIYNSYNYFFDDPYPDHPVSVEGDPLPVGTKIGESQSEITNNKIGLEIMADGLPDAYTKIIDGAAYFSPGYEYVFSVEGTGDEIWGLSSSCDMSFTFRLKVVPETVYWRGGTGNTAVEWNNDANWYSSESADINTFAPLPQTKVIIPAGLSQYSTLYEGKYMPEKVQIGSDSLYNPVYEETGYDLSRQLITFDLDAGTLIEDATATPFIEFDYNYVPNSCDTIYFRQGYDDVNKTPLSGAQLARTDLLNYTTAKVDLAVKTMQWYCLAPPLRDMYSGDYAFERTNPLVEMRYHDTETSEVGANIFTWTRSLPNTTVPLEAGAGYSLSVGKLYYEQFKPNPDDGAVASSKTYLDSAVFNFPKTNTTYYFYNEVNKKLIDKVETLPSGGRKYAGRFIYEVTENDESIVPDGDILLNIPTNRTDKEELIIVGNPFMSAFDFEQFYKLNRDVIIPAYKIQINGNDFITLSGIDYGSGNIDEIESTTGDLTLRSIFPMQSFIVTTREGYDGNPEALAITKNMSVANGESATLRLVAKDRPKRICIQVSKDSYSTQAIVKFGQFMNNHYMLGEDSRRILISEVATAPSVYTIVDGIYLDINRMKEMPESLPIGISTNNTGKTEIAISGVNTLNNEYYLYLKDTEVDVMIPIDSDNFSYWFENTDGDLIGRFYLVRVNKNLEEGEDGSNDDGENILSVTKQVGQEKAILIYSCQQTQTLHALSTNGSEINDLKIYSSDGRLIFENNNIGKTYYEVNITDLPSMLIIKASTDEQSVTTKVLNY